MKANNVITDPEFGVDSRYNSKQELVSEATLLMEARLRKLKNLSDTDIRRARLMQLKLRMETFLKDSFSENRSLFQEFLATYADTIYSKRGQFAHDIDITPVLLSQIINNHRDPQDEFLKRLMVHSEKVYSDICAFNSRLWYEVYLRDKITTTISNESEWRPKVETHVNISVTLGN